MYSYIQNILDTYIIYMHIQNILDTYNIYVYTKYTDMPRNREKR